MRSTLAVTMLALSAVAAVAAGGAWAMQGAPAPAPAAQPLQTFDVPMSGKPQTVYILKRSFTPGEHLGFHTHDGAEITQVLSGSIRLDIRGQTGKVYNAGDSFLIPRGTVHDPINVGTGDAALAVTYVLDKGAPLRVMAP